MLEIDSVHIMVDIETWGTEPGCAIRSIGAAAWCFEDPEQTQPRQFYVNISDESNAQAGLIKQADTVEWWLNQSQDAKDALTRDQQPLLHALQAFKGWLDTLGPNKQVFWAKPSTFDFPILAAAHKALSVPLPWEYWQVRDLWSYVDGAGFDVRHVKFEGTAHDALWDACNQLTALRAAYAHTITKNSAEFDAGEAA